MRYVVARLEEYRRETTYRVYLTDSIYLYAHGKMFSKRYIDFVNEQGAEEVDADEIVKSVIERAGLTIGDERGQNES